MPPLHQRIAELEAEFGSTYAMAYAKGWSEKEAEGCDWAPWKFGAILVICAAVVIGLGVLWPIITTITQSCTHCFARPGEQAAVRPQSAGEIAEAGATLIRGAADGYRQAASQV